MFVFYSTRTHDPRQYPECYTFRGYYVDVEMQAALLIAVANQWHGPSACVWMVPGTEG
jgi:hypothetical protein